MNEIRKNNETEETLLKLSFEMPKIYKIIWVIVICLSSTPFISLLRSNIEMSLYMGFFYVFPETIFMLIIPLILLIIFLRILKRVPQWNCEITNKNIKIKCGVFGTNLKAYRLDMIDDVEISEFLGVSRLKLLFTKGKKNQTVVVVGTNNSTTMGVMPVYITWLIEVQKAYDKLIELLGSIKNEVDLEVDIEMKKIEAENKKAEAFFKIADGFSGKSGNNKEDGGDYISQMERLYKLKEQGIISEEEFNEKKKSLL